METEPKQQFEGSCLIERGKDGKEKDGKEKEEEKEKERSKVFENDRRTSDNPAVVAVRA